MSTQIDTIPGYLPGTWTIDPVHSEASFVVRHLGISKVRGRFDTFEGQIVTAENPLASSVTAEIRTGSVNTANKQRDDHVRSDDFLAVDKHPTMAFASTGVRADGEKLLVDGDLTLRGVTKPVTLELEVNGFGDGMDGKPIASFSATTEISRSDFGVMGGPAGGVVSDKVKISLEVEANKAD